MTLARRWIPGVGAAVAILALSYPEAQGQRAPQTKEGASIVVDGVVREIFRSPRQTQTDYLVQVEVSRSEYGRSPADPRRVQAPAPGDQIYVHLSQATGSSNRPGVAPAATLPDERTRIRAYLYPRTQGGWEGAYPDWYDQLNASIASRGASDPEPPADVPLRPSPGSAPAAPAQADSILQKLGVKAEQVQVNGRLVFKVSELIPGGPAQNAGIEPGDAIIGIDNGFITSLDQFASVLLKGGQSTLAVLDVNTGKTASVRIDMSGTADTAAPAPQPTPTPAPAPVPAPGPPRVLGVKTEVVRVGLRSRALKVTEIQPGSPAEKAGIEKGDVIVAANKTPTGDLSSLNAAIQNSGPVLSLTIRDSRTGKDVPVQVQFGAAPAAAPPSGTPAPSSPTGGGAGSSQALGIITEAGTADLLPVVKVVRVQSGSPAEKAGIEEGDAIVGLNDKVIFAPDLLDEALKNAGNSFTLIILDVKTGRKTPVKINLP
jgi:serine protease Do